MKPQRPHYTYKLPPLGKQLDVIEETWHEPIWAVLGRPGTGKSKMCIDTACMQFMAGMIEAMIIISPEGVHMQWVDEAFPTHAPDGVPWFGGYYSSRMGKTAMSKLEARMRSRDMGLRVLSLSFDGLQTPRGKSLASAVVDAYRCLVLVDESHRVSNTKGAGYKAAMKIMRRGKTRRIATGTLFRQNPFSAYGQFELMGDDLLGFASLASFKSQYAEILPPKNPLVMKIAADFKSKTGRDIAPQVLATGPDNRPIYRNLPDLRRRLERWSSIISLADVAGKEPVILTSTRYVQLTEEQQRIYTDLEELGAVELDRGLLTAEGTLSLSIRLSQVIGGFVPSDMDIEAQPIPGRNPKLEELMALIDELGSEKLVVWCKYVPELRAVHAAIERVYGQGSAVLYYGQVNSPDRKDAKLRFINDPNCRVFVGQQNAGGTGLDGMQGCANYMCFYSNVYSYLDREQAIARLARLNGASVVNVVDLMVAGSIDEDIVRCIQSARDVTDAVLRRRLTREGTPRPH